LAANTVGVLTPRFTEFVRTSDARKEVKDLVVYYLGDTLGKQKDPSKHSSRRSFDSKLKNSASS
jgi:hypothetical protein